jgi:hypothetical protein
MPLFALACSAQAAGVTGYYEGSLDGRLPVRMYLSETAQSLSGYYLYVRVGRPIYLQGSLANDGGIHLEEYDAAKPGKSSGAFDGQVRKDGELRGTWAADPKKKSLAFQLKPALDAAERARKYYEGEDVDVDAGKALQFAKEALWAGRPSGLCGEIQYELGGLKKEGVNIFDCYKLESPDYRDPLHDGSPKANMAFLLLVGCDVKQDLAQAKKLADDAGDESTGPVDAVEAWFDEHGTEEDVKAPETGCGEGPSRFRWNNTLSGGYRASLGEDRSSNAEEDHLAEVRTQNKLGRQNRPALETFTTAWDNYCGKADGFAYASGEFTGQEPSANLDLGQRQAEAYIKNEILSSLISRTPIKAATVLKKGALKKSQEDALALWALSKARETYRSSHDGIADDNVGIQTLVPAAAADLRLADWKELCESADALKQSTEELFKAVAQDPAQGSVVGEWAANEYLQDQIENVKYSETHDW